MLQKILNVIYCPILLLALAVLFTVNNARAEQSLSQLEQALDKNTVAQGLALLYEFDVYSTAVSELEKGQYFFLLGRQYQKATQLDESVTSYNQAIDTLKSLPTSDTLIESYLGRSFVLYLKTNDPEIYCPDRVSAISYAREYPNAELLVKTLTQNAFCFNNIQNVHLGLLLLDEALTIAKEEHLSLNQEAMLYNATGSLYRTSELHERAYINFNKAYLIWRQLDARQEIFNMLHNMVSEAIKLSQWEKAKQGVKLSFALAKDSPSFKDFNFFSHLNAGRVALGEKVFNRAVYHFEKAVSLKDTTNESYFVSGSYAFLAQAYFRDGQAHKAADAAKVFMQDKSFPVSSANLRLSAEAILAFDRQDYFGMVDKFLQIIDSERENNNSIIDSEIIYSSLDHNSKLAEFENILLENKLAINQLNLTSVEDKKHIAELTISVTGLISVILVILTLFLFQSRRTFKHRSQTDFLTGISNRGHTFEEGEKLINRAIKQHQSVAVILFDIDDFKKINDNYGHHIGDLAIKTLAKRAKNLVKNEDIIGRIGGEEFLIVLPNTSELDAFNISERLRQGVANQSFQFGEVSLNFTISLGIALLDEPSRDLAALVKQADNALYSAKYGGKNRALLARECA